MQHVDASCSTISLTLHVNHLTSKYFYQVTSFNVKRWTEIEKRLYSKAINLLQYQNHMKAFSLEDLSLNFILKKLICLRLFHCKFKL